MTRAFVGLVCGVCLAACAGASKSAEPERPGVQGPSRGVELTEWAQACWHWSGEDSEDPGRVAEIRRNVDAACGTAKAQLAQVRPAELEPGLDAVLSVFLLGETQERCAQVPKDDLPHFDVD